LAEPKIPTLNPDCRENPGLRPRVGRELPFGRIRPPLVAGIRIASALFAGPTLGMVVLPIMIYHPLQRVVSAWLARRFASRRAPVAVFADGPLLPVGAAAQ
jgi:hypothetical protein